MVDILSGGYPCQPFSSAGKRAGADDPRHLWPYIRDGIRRMAPGICFFENVEGHISLGLSSVISDLEELGYQVSWGIFSAAEVGAPHQRKRVFIMAHNIGARLERFAWYGARENYSRGENQNKAGSVGESGFCNVWPSRPGQPQYAWEPPRVVVDSASKQASSGRELCGTQCGQEQGLSSESDDAGAVMGNAESREDNGRESGGMGCTTSEGGCSNDAADSAGEGVGESTRKLSHGSGTSSGEARCSELADSSEWEVEPTLGRSIARTPGGLDYAELCVTCDNRTDELRLLGNGVVPATAEKAFKTLVKKFIQ